MFEFAPLTSHYKYVKMVSVSGETLSEMAPVHQLKLKGALNHPQRE